MRKVIYGGATSVDQMLARDDGSVDWLIMDVEAMELMKDMWDRFDVIVMGRKTWSTAMANFSEEDLKKAEEMKSGIRSVVFSKTLEPGTRGGYDVVNDDPGEFVRDLKEQDGNDICVMGGGELARELFEAGVIDEVGFNIHPVLLGGGIPAFHKMSRQIDLELLACTAMKNGCVYVLYGVKN
jgi:dihydrofolate reductase